MRQIKFRAWWKNEKYLPEGKMYKVGGITFAIPDGGEPESYYQGKPVEIGLMDYDCNTSKIGWNKAEECDPMQFTGLLDKNGKEIYEGDIITHPVAYLLDRTGIVVWGKSGWFLEEITESANRHSFFSQMIERSEVIGNIYENPELLHV